MKRKAFILYTSFYPPIMRLTDEQRGVLFNALFLFAMDEELPQMDDMTSLAFDFIAPQLQADKEKYEDICRKRSDAGKRHKGNQYTTNGTSVPTLEQNGTNGTKNKDKNKDKDKNNNKDKDKDDDIIPIPNGTNGTSVPTYADRLKDDDVMLAAICSATALSKERLIALLPEFENQLYIDGRRHTNYPDYRRHFQMYASKNAEYQRQQNQQQKTQDNGGFRTNTERRRGKAYDVSKIEPEDYKPF